MKYLRIIHQPPNSYIKGLKNILLLVGAAGGGRACPFWLPRLDVRGTKQCRLQTVMLWTRYCWGQGPGAARLHDLWNARHAEIIVALAGCEGQSKADFGPVGILCQSRCGPCATCPFPPVMCTPFQRRFFSRTKRSIRCTYGRRFGRCRHRISSAGL